MTEPRLADGRASPIRAIACALAFLAVGGSVAAQSDSGRVTVVVRGENRPLAEADVRGPHLHARTDRSGRTVLHLPVGPWQLVIAHVGFRPETLSVTVRPGLDTLLTTELVQQAEELASVVVTATRVSHEVQDDPTRVEVLAGEEISEKTQTQPGNLGLLLQEMSGVRVQPAAPVFGAAGIRIQGLPSEYTQVLSDGLPLLGAQFGELGLAEVPPLDLRQVEVIKGAATALYGPSALGGVVNLVSRLPGDERELVFNQTSQAGTDGLTWLSHRWSDNWGATFLGGVHEQSERDVDGDGWADVPGFRRVELRPRLYWNGAGGASLFATVGGMTEHRIGGTMPGIAAVNRLVFPTASNVNRFDGGLVAVFPIRTIDTLTVRSSATRQWDRQDFGPVASYSTQHGRHQTLFSEATLTIPWGRATWLVGAGFEQDVFDSPELSGFDYRFTTPSLFAQATRSFGPRVAITASGRCDWNSQYGTFCNPRVSALFHASPAWTVRLTGATGFFAPTPFIEETEGIPLARLVPFDSPTIATCTPHLCANDSGTVATTAPFAIQAERAQYGSLDVTRRAGPLNLTATLFASSVDHPLILSELNIFDERPQLVNAVGPTRTAGGELFAVYAHEPVSVLVQYAYLRSTETSPILGGRTETPLTPRHSGGLDLAWESDETNTRVALHVFYTGRQAVLGDPYRTITPPYATIGLLVSQRLGRAELYVSGANLGDVRQTRYDPLLSLAPGYDLRMTTDQWAPLDGRVINAGIRMAF